MRLSSHVIEKDERPDVSALTVHFRDVKVARDVQDDVNGRTGDIAVTIAWGD